MKKLSTINAMFLCGLILTPGRTLVNLILPRKQKLFRIFNKFYRPEYATILVVGDVTQEKVMALATKYQQDIDYLKQVASNK